MVILQRGNQSQTCSNSKLLFRNPSYRMGKSTSEVGNSHAPCLLNAVACLALSRGNQSPPPSPALSTILDHRRNNIRFISIECLWDLSLKFWSGGKIGPAGQKFTQQFWSVRGILVRLVRLLQMFPKLRERRGRCYLGQSQRTHPSILCVQKLCQA